jgi:hypothetical protein
MFDIIPKRVLYVLNQYIAGNDKWSSPADGIRDEFTEALIAAARRAFAFMYTVYISPFLAGKATIGKLPLPIALLSPYHGLYRHDFGKEELYTDKRRDYYIGVKTEKPADVVWAVTELIRLYYVELVGRKEEEICLADPILYEIQRGMNITAVVHENSWFKSVTVRVMPQFYPRGRPFRVTGMLINSDIGEKHLYYYDHADQNKLYDNMIMDDVTKAV